MFDIGFWELLIIGVVALLIVGPERLPGLVTFVGHWVGRLRRFANHMRSQIQEELETEQLKNLLDEQNRELNELRREVDEVRDDTARSLNEARDAVERGTQPDTHPANEPTPSNEGGAQAPEAATSDGAATSASERGDDRQAPAADESERAAPQPSERAGR